MESKIACLSQSAKTSPLKNSEPDNLVLSANLPPGYVLVTYEWIGDVPPTPILPLMATVLAEDLSLWKATLIDKEQRSLSVAEIRFPLHAKDHATRADL